MEFFNEVLNTISKSEAFLIVISGVVIYTIQQLVSQLWITPIQKFRECRAQIETLMNRWDFLHKYTEGKSSSTDSHGSMDERIKTYRKQLNEVTTELIYTYNSLPTIERLLLKIQCFDVKQSKTSLLILSVVIATNGDWETGDSKAAAEIQKIYKSLKLSRYLIKSE